MPTIIERIAAAEADAEALRSNAQESARQLTAAAEDAAAASLKNAREEAKAGLALASAMAEKEAEEEYERLLTASKVESEKLIAGARERVAATAESVLEHIADLF